MRAFGLLLLLLSEWCAVAANLIERELVYKAETGKDLNGYLIYQDSKHARARTYATTPRSCLTVHARTLPSAVPGNPVRPGLLLFSGFWGDGGGEPEREYAREYARRGMVVFLPDFMTGRHSDVYYLPFIYSFLLYEPFLADTVKAQKRALIAWQTLTALDIVDADRIGAIGFCFGGAMTLNLARSGAKVRVISSNHGEYPHHGTVTGASYNVDFFLEGIGENDVLIPAKARHKWDEELRADTQGTAKQYEIVIWPNNVHGFSIVYSNTLYNTFQLFGLNSLAKYNHTTAVAHFARIDALFKQHGLLAANAPPTYTPPEPARGDTAPFPWVSEECSKGPCWFIRFLEGLANAFRLQHFYTTSFVPLAGAFIASIDPEGESLGGVLFFIVLIVAVVFVTCCTCCCKLCCCPLKRKYKRARFRAKVAARPPPIAITAGDSSATTYVCRPKWAIGLTAVAANMPFLGCFFGIRSASGTWPLAWWAFLMLAFWPLHSMAHKIESSKGAVVVFGVFGNIIKAVPTESIAQPLTKGRTAASVVLAMTPEGHRAEKAANGCCFKCCVSKR